MTEHLPECWNKHESDPPAWCICDELRACEERVTTAAVQRVEALGWDYTYRSRGAILEYVNRAKAITAIKGDQP
jgi:hypothetical protein